MEDEFIIRSVKEHDPVGVMLLSARDKVLNSNSPQLKIIQQLPNAELPTRFLVAGDESSLRILLDEFKQALIIERNKKIVPF